MELPCQALRKVFWLRMIRANLKLHPDDDTGKQASKAWCHSSPFALFANFSHRDSSGHLMPDGCMIERRGFVCTDGRGI